MECNHRSHTHAQAQDNKLQNGHHILITRKEKPEYIAAIRFINEQAFGGTVEADIVEKLRERGLLTISLVAIQDNEIIGHIAFSPAKSNRKIRASKQYPLLQWQFSPHISAKGLARS